MSNTQVQTHGVTSVELTRSYLPTTGSHVTEVLFKDELGGVLRVVAFSAEPLAFVLPAPPVLS